MYRLFPPQTPIDGRVYIPGSKSYSNRALIIAALGKGDSLLRGISPSEDTDLLCRALEQVGVVFLKDEQQLRVRRRAPDLSPAKGTIDLGPAGTSMRFFTALCASIPGTDCVLCGSERMHQRPIAELVDALRAMGAVIEYLGKNGCPPLRVQGRKLSGGRVVMSGSESSQFLSALLLIAPQLNSDLEIEVQGGQVSESYLEMTLETLASFGVHAQKSQGSATSSYVCKSGQQIKCGEYFVQGDASGASYFMGIAALSGGRVTVDNISLDSVQGDARFAQLLGRMGCEISSGMASTGPWVAVKGPAELRAIHADMVRMPDTAQTLAVVASCAKGCSELQGLQTLVHKETDRLTALCTELARVGISAQADSDSIRVEGGNPHAARIRTYDDHRMAMCFAMLGVRVPGIEIEDPNVVRKSFPEFWEKLAALGIRVD